MALRTRNEKILLAILGGIIFVSANFYGYRWLAQKQSGLDMTKAQLQADNAEATVDLQKLDLWARRQDWIGKHELKLGDEGEAKAQVLEAVLKGVRDNKLEVLEQSINDVQHGSAGARVNVAVKVKGSMEGLCKWLASLQKPEEFYAVSFFSLKADQDQKSMVCSLQLARYFKEGS